MDNFMKKIIKKKEKEVGYIQENLTTEEFDEEAEKGN